MKLGIEVEFVVPNNSKLKNRFTFNKKSGIWTIGTDGSLLSGSGKHNFNGLELRSSILGDNWFPDLKSILNEIVENKGETTKTCGIHFHFSGLGQVNRIAFINNMNKLYPNMTWKSRKKWCATLPSAREKEKYQILRLVNMDHYECRSFNGTLNPRAILQYYRILLSVLSKDGVLKNR